MTLNALPKIDFMKIHFYQLNGLEPRSWVESMCHFYGFTFRYKIRGDRMYAALIRMPEVRQR
jgi:hypothetical protein